MMFNPQGEAFVRLASDEDAAACLRHDRKSMGRRYIEVFRFVLSTHALGPRGAPSPLYGFFPVTVCLSALLRSSLSELQDAESLLRAKGQLDAGYTGCVRVRGLPWSAGESDVRAFFAGCEIEVDGIHLVVNRQGRATGEVGTSLAPGTGASSARNIEYRLC